MISKTILQQAAEKNIIDSQQIEPLYQFIQHQQGDTVSDNREEPLKFIRSFGDVFITLGVILLSIAINMTELSGYYYWLPVIAFVVIAEWLVGVRRLALPGIAILLSILFFVNKAIAFDHENATLFGAGILSLTSLLFYLRYKMPFSLLPLAAGLVAMIIIQIGLDIINNPVIFVAPGLIVFVAAIWFDSQDTARLTHLSDNAFWLHLLAAPLIVHGTMISILTSDLAWIQSINKEILIVIFFTGFFLLALLIDRRAILISTQLYMIYALTQLLQNQLSSTQNTMVYILMALSLFVIFFGTYWYMARRLIFGFLSGSVISRYLPDLIQKDTK
ncbi:MAG: hypothetical protein OQL06_16245 [Gammaproteobacteria bacterium]|nr:hypothetical protein [Gammaproteobacteria bacterium]